MDKQNRCRQGIPGTSEYVWVRREDLEFLLEFSEFVDEETRNRLKAALEISCSEAAVPDLVEALEALMLYTGVPPTNQYSYDNLWEDAWKKSKKALAKVKGKRSITK